MCSLCRACVLSASNWLFLLLSLGLLQITAQSNVFSCIYAVVQPVGKCEHIKMVLDQLSFSDFI